MCRTLEDHSEAEADLRTGRSSPREAGRDRLSFRDSGPQSFLFSEGLYIERLMVDSDSATRLCNRHRLPVLRDLFVIDNFLSVPFVGSFDRIWIDQFVEKIPHIAP